MSCAHNHDEALAQAPADVDPTRTNSIKINPTITNPRRVPMGLMPQKAYRCICRNVRNVVSNLKTKSASKSTTQRNTTVLSQTPSSSVKTVVKRKEPHHTAPESTNTTFATRSVRANGNRKTTQRKTTQGGTENPTFAKFAAMNTKCHYIKKKTQSGVLKNAKYKASLTERHGVQVPTILHGKVALRHIMEFGGVLPREDGNTSLMTTEKRSGGSVNGAAQDANHRALLMSIISCLFGLVARTTKKISWRYAGRVIARLRNSQNGYSERCW